MLSVQRPLPRPRHLLSHGPGRLRYEQRARMLQRGRGLRPGRVLPPRQPGKRAVLSTVLADLLPQPDTLSLRQGQPPALR
jgi:hypothetical protein